MSPQEQIESLIADRNIEVIWQDVNPLNGCYLVEAPGISPWELIITLATIEKTVGIQVAPGDVGSGKLILPRPNGQLSYWICLHEIGHKMMGHGWKDLSTDLVATELEAWIWAHKHTLVDVVEPVRDYIAKAIRGYRRQQLVTDRARSVTEEFCQRTNIQPQEVGLDV